MNKKNNKAEKRKSLSLVLSLSENVSIKMVRNIFESTYIFYNNIILDFSLNVLIKD